MFTCSLLLVSMLFNSIQYLSAADPHWDYGSLGPDVWKDFYPQCGDSSQSPINIRTACTTYKELPAFQFSPGYDLPQEFLLTNNGHTITGVPINASTDPLTLTGGGLGEPFTFANMHLHWGENYNSGSEHQLNGEKYAGEIHFVHSNADKSKNAVLAIFMKSKKPENHTEDETTKVRRRKRHTNNRDVLPASNDTLFNWHDYFVQAGTLKYQTSTTTMNLTLSTLMSTDLTKFYRYGGSLTTPPCTENVIWTVFETTLEFPDGEIASFRANIYFEDYRGPQPVNDRTVYRSFPNATPSPISDYACCENRLSSTPVFHASLINGNSAPSMNNELLFYILFFVLILLI